MKTDRLISARRPNVIIFRKKGTCQIVYFADPVDCSVKIERKGKER